MIFIKRLLQSIGAVIAGSALLGGVQAADIDYGKPGEPVKVVVGYQPYYTQAWSGVVISERANAAASRSAKSRSGKSTVSVDSQ